MPMNRRELLKVSVAGAAMLNQGRKAFAAPPGNIQASIDAAKIGGADRSDGFGGYMEPATTSVWAEMLSDRKFAKPGCEWPAGASESPFYVPASVASRSGRWGRKERSKWTPCGRSLASTARASSSTARPPRHSAVQIARGPRARL